MLKLILAQNQENRTFLPPMVGQWPSALSGNGILKLPDETLRLCLLGLLTQPTGQGYEHHTPVGNLYFRTVDVPAAVIEFKTIGIKVVTHLSFVSTALQNTIEKKALVRDVLFRWLDDTPERSKLDEVMRSMGENSHNRLAFATFAVLIGVTDEILVKSDKYPEQVSISVTAYNADWVEVDRSKYLYFTI